MRERSEVWKRRQAITIAAQLPENLTDARAVLHYAMELVDGFLARTTAETDQPLASVLPFPASSSALSEMSRNRSK